MTDDMRRRLRSHAIAMGATVLFAATAFASSARSTAKAALAAGPRAVSQDFGDVSVLVDNGLMVTHQNLFDLDGTTVRFTPAGDHLYTVSAAPGAVDPDVGPALVFGMPGTSFPGDDDSQEVPFSPGFPFFGAVYGSVWVNTDGNVTLGAPDFESTPRDKPRLALGIPRIAAFLHDWNAFNALNPAGSGTIHAVAKTAPDRLVVTWHDVADFEGGVASTFQVVLGASGIVEVTFEHLDPASVKGVVGLSEGGGAGPLQLVDFTSPSTPRTFAAGTILEAFSSFTVIDDRQIAREFYRSHPDDFDFLVVQTDFVADGAYFATGVSNQTHGIGNLSLSRGATSLDTLFDMAADYGSAGELETFVFMNDVFQFWPDAGRLVDPPIAPYSSSVNVIDWFDNLGGAVSLDGQPMSQVRIDGTLAPDGGEWSRHFARGGEYSNRLFSPMVLMSHEILHRWCARVLFVHPTKGVGFDSFDLLGRDTQHWSWFVDTSVPAGSFADAPRSSVMEGNVIVDLGRPAAYRGAPVLLDAGEHVFATPTTALVDGYSALDQHLMGLRRATAVGPFFYVDEPKSILTGQSLDAFDAENPLNTAVTMRGWSPMGGIAFKGKRVDLTIQNIQDYEALREGRDNPRGRRFWGPRGNLRVRYFRGTGLVDPAGDASVVLSESDRELGDEADAIDAAGKPIDVKTQAFILLVESGTPSAHSSAIAQVDAFRRAWQDYGNGPATGGRGQFDTRLAPPIH
jgi:hypothetical protein